MKTSPLHMLGPRHQTAAGCRLSVSPMRPHPAQLTPGPGLTLRLYSEKLWAHHATVTTPGARAQPLGGIGPAAWQVGGQPQCTLQRKGNDRSLG